MDLEARQELGSLLVACTDMWQVVDVLAEKCGLEVGRHLEKMLSHEINDWMEEV